MVVVTDNANASLKATIACNRNTAIDILRERQQREKRPRENPHDARRAKLTLKYNFPASPPQPFF